MFLVIGYCILFGFLMATCYIKQLKQFHLLAKMLMSLGFITIFAVSALSATNFLVFFRLLPAFAFCFLGDTFLALNKQNTSNKSLLAGVISFLFGHIAFAVYFSRYVPLGAIDFIIPFLGVLLAIRLIKLPLMEVRTMKIPVLFYSFFVSLLFSKGLSLIVSSVSTCATLLVIAGTLLFFISDIITLFILFYKRKPKSLMLLNLLTYYCGMLLLALSAFHF